MAEEGKEEEKQEFTPEGETLGYISLDQARVLAIASRFGTLEPGMLFQSRYEEVRRGGKR